MATSSITVRAADIIPFFHDMPEEVIPYAAQLWDQASAPNYNGQTAYQDFVSDLQFMKVEPPTRAIVRRWVAGVQAGLISRPGFEKVTDASGSNKPPLSPIRKPDIAPRNDQRASVLASQKKLVAALPDFQSAPSEKGKLEARQVDASVSSADGSEVSRPVIVGEVGPDGTIGIVDIVHTAGTPADFETFAARLYDATLAEIQKSAAVKASKLVASRLREIADRYDAPAA